MVCPLKEIPSFQALQPATFVVGLLLSYFG